MLIVRWSSLGLGSPDLEGYPEDEALRRWPLGIEPQQVVKKPVEPQRKHPSVSPRGLAHPQEGVSHHQLESDHVWEKSLQQQRC